MLTLILFYPRSPCGERPWQRGSRITYVDFLSTLSLRRATPIKRKWFDMICFSIHALLAESDGSICFDSRLLNFFYPRSPCGERPSTQQEKNNGHEFSIHALLAESDGQAQSLKIAPLCFSIHALLAESDARRPGQTAKADRFSIHALLAESDSALPRKAVTPRGFLSTLSLRRATWSSPRVTVRTWNFLSTLSLRRATTVGVGALDSSIFLSTLSLRRATSRGSVSMPRYRIFYPRSPCGERQSASYHEYMAESFSIHALLAESDPNADWRWPEYFNFSIHALLAESDMLIGDGRNILTFSIHALLAESDGVLNLDRWLAGLFLSTLSLRRATVLF